MVMNVCEKLSEEHQKFCFSLVSRKNYNDEEVVDKFKHEITRFNHFGKTLTHNDYSFCRYHAIRAQRESQRSARRLCEIVDHKLERVAERAWEKN